jgi:hypothetical protein
VGRTEQVLAGEGTIDTFETMKEDALEHGSVVATLRRPSATAGSLDPRMSAVEAARRLLTG